ncbi:MAG: diguanylate cyclase [Proteobacteria bacterium]|nr:diguanylate cyclase [Pseudomonadota bacterium]
MQQKFRDLTLTTKFLGSIALILLVLTFLDINYNARKERELTQNEIKRWTFRLAENVRVALNTLMREGKMDIRFSMLQTMQEELEGIKNVRIVRAERTNELFNEMNKKEVIPSLEKAIRRSMAEIPVLEEELSKAIDADLIDDLKDEIAELEKDLLGLRGKLGVAQEDIIADPRELPRDDMDLKVLKEGQPIYQFNGDFARVLVPYKVDRKKCSEGSGCHRNAREGDILGAINIEFSMETISADIRENKLWMVLFWFMRFIIFLVVIGLLLTFIVTRDIKSMLKVFKKVEKGDFSVRAEVRGKDEFGEMATAFNRMVQSLEDTKKELDKSLLEVFALYNIGKAVNTNFELEQILLSLVQGLGRSEKIDKTMIMLADKDSGLLSVASYTGFEDGEIGSTRRKPGEGFYGAVAAEGKGELVSDVEKYIDFPAEDIFGAEVNSIIAVPFFRGDSIFGLICAYKNKPDHFDLSDLKLFEGMAEHLTVVLNNAKLVEETRIKAIRDSLTGLYNRRYFNETLEKEYEKALRHERYLSLFMIDIDNFKYYNDTNGHPEGDKVLEELSEILRHTVRSTDIACRYGGEEFVVILPETSKDGAMLIGERVVSAIHRHTFAHEESQPMGFVSVSAGLATFPEDGETSDDIVKRADEALYRAKRLGKNRIEMA